MFKKTKHFLSFELSYILIERKWVNKTLINQLNYVNEITFKNIEIFIKLIILAKCFDFDVARLAIFE